MVLVDGWVLRCQSPGCMSRHGDGHLVARSSHQVTIQSTCGGITAMGLTTAYLVFMTKNVSLNTCNRQRLENNTTSGPYHGHLQLITILCISLLTIFNKRPPGWIGPRLRDTWSCVRDCIDAANDCSSEANRQHKQGVIFVTSAQLIASL